MEESARRLRDARVRRVLVYEGAANLLALAAKLLVGFTTQSAAILGDALHSLTDVANNVLAWLAARISSAPPDRSHPYGHQKFEFLAVFVLATLLGVMAIEIAIHAVERAGEPVATSGWALALMIGVLALNIGVTTWQHYWARRLSSELLRADARHTLADVLITTTVIIGWQLASRGHPYLDMVFALFVSAVVLYLAWGLFRRAIPTLVDQAAVDSDRLKRSVQAVRGVRDTHRVRTRKMGADVVADVVVSVDGTISTETAHRIADQIERKLAEEFGITDVTVHVEPH